MDEKKIASARTETNPTLMKNLFRTYYEEKYGTVKIVTLISAILLFIAAAAVYCNGASRIWAAILVWAGLMLIIYPRNAYRKPYRKARNTHTVTHFEFYEDRMSEHTAGETNAFKYSEIYKTVETNQYFYIFHSPENVSVVEKSEINGSEEELRTLLKFKTKYKRKK